MCNTSRWFPMHTLCSGNAIQQLANGSEKIYTSSYTRNCVNNLDPTFCTPGNNPFLIKFEAQQKSGTHVVYRIEGKNGQYSTEDDDDRNDEHSADALVTQFVLAVGSITTFLAIVICIFVSCRHSRYRNCDSASERSSPRTVQTEMAELVQVHCQNSTV
ncbi:unnamed protein product [Mytilus coruscus]|uniref:Uncharacterized protein n=1 Tax=Mytilus coruscus TaxID=42192 RepID=A0A6J8BJX3_MYTCO|nr:unnamed protein product [Mytilus coruscus]